MRNLEKKYCRRVAAAIPCERKLKESIVNRLREQVHTYLTDHPNADLMELESVFGHPNKIAENYVAEMAPETVVAQLHKWRGIYRIVCIVAVTMLALWTFSLTLALIKVNTTSSGTYYFYPPVEYQETTENSSTP